MAFDKEILDIQAELNRARADVAQASASLTIAVERLEFVQGRFKQLTRLDAKIGESKDE